jgi:thymidylate synthase
MAILIKTLTVERAWRALVNRICRGGSIIEDERGSKIKEVLNTVVVIKNPLNEDVPEGYFWQGEKLEKYKEQFMSKDRQGFTYTYGNRIRDHFEVDQLDEAIHRLQNSQVSRRATMITWDPEVDPFAEDVPCMIMVDFKIRDGKLRTTGVWRSHDIYGAFYPNLMGLAHMAKYVAKEVGVEVGPMTVQSISAHIYEHNWEEAERFIS